MTISNINNDPLVAAFNRVIEIARHQVVNRRTDLGAYTEAAAKQSAEDLAAIDLVCARTGPLIQASEALWLAYYGPGSNHEDVEWSDVEHALDFACRGLGKPNEQPEFINTYDCPKCGHHWQDQWTSTCDDRCPQCDTSCSPTHSEDA